MIPRLNARTQLSPQFGRKFTIKTEDPGVNEVTRLTIKEVLLPQLREHLQGKTPILMAKDISFKRSPDFLEIAVPDSVDHLLMRSLDSLRQVGHQLTGQSILTISDNPAEPEKPTRLLLRQQDYYYMVKTYLLMTKCLRDLCRACPN
jgi:hypothetical protein